MLSVLVKFELNTHKDVKLYVLPQWNNIFKRSIGIGSILDELNIFFFQNCYLKLVPMNFDKEF